VGYRASSRGRDLELQVGYSPRWKVKPRQGVEFEVPVPTQVSSRHRQAARRTDRREIRKVRPPEPTGQGHRYEGEYVRRKVGSAH